ncbi:MerR family DNA-binding transcriptional regulator [Deinococcus oregonensis]|uniref:MerR family DNA-binding transcriptional regulator n=1 Tax=Deinococcus oregonensis TaxID=1805970 RepID=A0ABV6B8U4_9DEIO
MSARLLIGQVAVLLGVTTKTIRHYHALGLIAEPSRGDNGYRLYELGTLMQFRVIQRLQEAGLSLRQIHALQSSVQPQLETARTLQVQLQATETEIQKLQLKQQRLVQLLQAEDVLSAALAPQTPFPVPEALRDALSQLALPADFLAFDLAAFGEVEALGWLPEQRQLWLDEVLTCLRHPGLPALLSKLVDLLQNADQLNETELRRQGTDLWFCVQVLGEETSPSPAALELTALLTGYFTQFVQSGQISEKQQWVLQLLDHA